MKQIITECCHPIKIWASEIEAEAIKQAQNVANLPIIYRHVALMPDVHAGKGSTIGTVIATKGAVIPSAVGVDIGCGMAVMSFIAFNEVHRRRSQKSFDLKFDFDDGSLSMRFFAKNIRC